MIEGVWYAICDRCERELGPYYSQDDAAEAVSGLGWEVREDRSALCNLCREDEE